MGCTAIRVVQLVLLAAIGTSTLMSLAVSFGYGTRDLYSLDSVYSQAPIIKPVVQTRSSHYNQTEVQMLLGDGSNIDPLPIYYVNLDGSTDRRELMEEMFEKLHLPQSTSIRVPAFDVEKIQTMLKKKLFRLKNGVSMEAPGGDEVWFKRQTNRYDFREGACLLSHLDSIRQAYQAGHEYALVLEDDALLTPKFVRYWKEYAQMAPEGWHILQWANDFDIIYNQGKKFTNDPWTIWFPEHWSARANMYSRKGMEHILGLTYSMDSKMRNVWTLRGEPTLVADELLYYYGKEVYTSTKPWISRFEVSTTLQEGASLPHIADHIVTQEVPQLNFTTREESLLVLSQYRFDSVEEIKRELQYLKQDVFGVCSMHVKCDWHINAIFTRQELARDKAFAKAQSTLPPNVYLHVQVTPKPINKYNFYGEFSSAMGNYDLVLLKDWDHRTAGFPWDTFVEKKGEAVMAAPLRQVPEDGMYKGLTRPWRIQFYFHDAHLWQLAWFTSWSSELFESVTPIRDVYLESYFVLMDGKFGEWYFPQVLIPDFLKQLNDYGPDYMWCHAATEYRPNRPNCHLVPVVTRYDEAKPDPEPPQEEEGSSSSWPDTLLTPEVLELYKNHDAKFESWYADVKYWIQVMNVTKLMDMELYCKFRPFDVVPFDLQECIDMVPLARLKSENYALAVALKILRAIGILVGFFLTCCLATGKGLQASLQQCLDLGIRCRVLSVLQRDLVLAFWGGPLACIDASVLRILRMIPFVGKLLPTKPRPSTAKKTNKDDEDPTLVASY